MSISRRQFVSGSAIAAASAAIPIAEATAESGAPLTEQEDIKTMLDILERQITKIRQDIADSEAEPIKSADAVRMEACVFHHRANALAHRSDIVRKLALGETLATQRAKYEKRMEARQALWTAVEERIGNIRKLSRAAVYEQRQTRDLEQTRDQKRQARMIYKECRALSQDYRHLFNRIIRLTADGA